MLFCLQAKLHPVNEHADVHQPCRLDGLAEMPQVMVSSHAVWFGVSMAALHTFLAKIVQFRAHECNKPS